MAASAPRLPWPLVAEIRRLAADRSSIAGICRDAGAFAERNGFYRPSYEHVRRLVHRERRLRELPGSGAALVDGWLPPRSPENAVDEAFRRAGKRRAARERIEAERVVATARSPGSQLLRTRSSPRPW